MTTLEVQLGDELMRFTSLAQWTCKAANWYRTLRREGHRPGRHVAIDAAGRICTEGGDFMRADREGTYPIRVYALLPY